MVLWESRGYQGMPAARFFNTVPNTLFPPLQGGGEIWTFQHWVGGKSEPSGICGWRWWPVVPRSTPPSTKTRQEQSCGQQGQRLGPPNFSWVVKRDHNSRDMQKAIKKTATTLFGSFWINGFLFSWDFFPWLTWQLQNHDLSWKLTEAHPQTSLGFNRCSCQNG